MEVFKELWAGNNQLFSEIATLFPDRAATSFTVGVGLVMLAGQCALSAYFSFVTTSGPWHAMPGFTAHQLIYFPLGLYTAYIGCAGWLGSNASTPAERILGEDAMGLHLAQLQLAILLFWDIPTGFVVKALRDPVMLCHHVGFALTALAVTQTCNTYYGLCFFGVVEVSSIPLCFADVFHPRQKEYSAWLEGAPITRALNDAVRAVFVLSYMLVRALYFPYVVWGCYVPDMRAVLLLPLAQRKGQSDGALWLPTFLGTAFSLLQLWWGMLLLKQLRKMMRPPPPAKKTD